MAEIGASRLNWGDPKMDRSHSDEAESLRDELRSLIEDLANQTGSPERRAGFVARPAVQAALTG